MINRPKCLICYNTGIEIYSKTINDRDLINFFFDYYGKSQIVKKFIKKLKKYKYTLLKCYKCQFIWQKYSLENKLQEELYDKLISPKKSCEKSKRSIKLFKDKFNFEFNILNKINPKKKYKILDYGAGWGSWILSLNYNLTNIFALEASKKRVKYLKMKKINVINFNDLKKKTKFDFIRLEQVLEHIDNFDHVFKNLKKILDNNSLVYISVPNSKILFNKKYRQNLLIKGPAQPLEHLNSFTPISINMLLKKHNFKKISPFLLLKAFFINKKFSLGFIKTVLRIIINNLNSTSILFKKNY